MKRRLFLAAMALVLAGCASTSTTPNQVDTQQLLSDVIDLAIKVQANKSASIPTPTPPAPVPTPTPLPAPEPVPVPPAPVPPVQAQITVWDADKIPGMMRDQGWTGTDNQLYFALFSTYGSHEWGYVGTDPVAIDLFDAGDKIKAWFTAYVQGIGNQLKANPGMTATIISGDANDKGGLFMVDPIRSQLLGMGCNQSQIIDGQIYRP